MTRLLHVKDSIAYWFLDDVAINAMEARISS
jgi:hypothetical protein